MCYDVLINENKEQNNKINNLHGVIFDLKNDIETLKQELNGKCRELTEA